MFRPKLNNLSGALLIEILRYVLEGFATITSSLSDYYNTYPTPSFNRDWCFDIVHEIMVRTTA